MKYFILLATFALITKIVSFPISIKTISEEAYYFNTVMQLINPNYPLKNEVKKMPLSGIFLPQGPEETTYLDTFCEVILVFID